MSKTFRPGSDAGDYAELLSKDVPVELTKITQGKGSAVGKGEVKSGHLEQPLAKGRQAIFKESGQGNTSEISDIAVDEAGRISVTTATSVYEVLSKAPDYRRVSLMYLRRGYLDFDDKMPDGFYDGGRHLEFEEDGHGGLKFQATPGREICLLDAKKDAGLEGKMKMAEKMLEAITDPRQRALMLAQFVSNVMGGIQVIGKATTDESDKEIAEWKKVRGDIILLGYLNHGVCRHRGLLYKYMADRLGIRSRLVRGDTSGPHVWNVVEINKELFLIDVMKNPFELVPIDDPRAGNYKRKGAGNSITGTIGGRSIPIK